MKLSSIKPIEPQNTTEVNKLIIKMFVYSAIKIIANNPLLYSVLNPDTSSDSPSAKSNGVRLVSAKQVINHIAPSGIIIKEIHEYWDIEISVKSNLWRNKRPQSKIKAILTSYEIVWAIPRRLPSKAYFEFEHQPAINTGYTFILEIDKNKSTPSGMYSAW